MKYLPILLCLAATAFADCGVPEALLKLRPGATWNVRGTNYAGIEWLDAAQTKPLASEVLTAVQDCVAAAAARRTLKVQARAVLKDDAATDLQKIKALVLLFDLDQ